MDTINSITSSSFSTENYLFILILLISLFFLQKYMYYFDQKIAKYSNREVTEKRKPWSFLVAMVLGAFIFFYNTFSPNDLTLDISEWRVEWVLIIIGSLTIAGIFLESINDFGSKSGLVRAAIYIVLMLPYFYAGLISGLLIVSLLALGILLYFLLYWKRLLTIK